jgi:hypothetical protein
VKSRFAGIIVLLSARWHIAKRAGVPLSFAGFPARPALSFRPILSDNRLRKDCDMTGRTTPDPDAPIPYMQRTRDYYRALGYETPYRWAHHDDAPFHPLAKPLSRARVTVVTTAAPFDPLKGDQGPGAKYNGGAKFFRVYAGDTAKDHDLRISHIAYDRVHTTAEDPNTWFPLPMLRRFAAEGRVELARRFFGAPTNRSQRTTIEIDAPEILAGCKEDGVDAAILVPNCPVCHQTVTLVARHLEANGISTVVMGCARDIVEYAGAPRFLFSDFPLGNSAGRPHDPGSQRLTLELALRLLESAPGPRTTMQSPLRWSDDPSWKLDYNNIDRLPPEELARLRRAFEDEKNAARMQRENAA